MILDNHRALHSGALGLATVSTVCFVWLTEVAKARGEASVGTILFQIALVLHLMVVAAAWNPAWRWSRAAAAVGILGTVPLVMVLVRGGVGPVLLVYVVIAALLAIDLRLVDEVDADIAVAD